MVIPIQSSTLSRRVGATIIDYTFLFAFFIWFVYSYGEPDGEGGYVVSGTAALIPVAVWFVYCILAEGIFGFTLGHYAVGLKVRSADGNAISFVQVVKRRICDAVEISWCFGLIAYILARNTQFHQRLGDIWAKTIVVELKEQLELKEFDFENTSVSDRR